MTIWTELSFLRFAVKASSEIASKAFKKILNNKSIVSSDWSDTMLDIAVTFFYHPIYMIIALDRVEFLYIWCEGKC